jgi:hypothetical protein
MGHVPQVRIPYTDHVRGQSPTSHREEPGSVPVQYTKWHWNSYLSDYFGLSYALAFHRHVTAHVSLAVGKMGPCEETQHHFTVTSNTPTSYKANLKKIYPVSRTFTQPKQKNNRTTLRHEFKLTARNDRLCLVF